MRQQASANGVTVKAYAGTTGVLLAMNVTPASRDRLLGFAIERRQGRAGAFRWLLNQLHFPRVPLRPGQLAPSNRAPLQKFRWSDYRVYPETRYTYVVHPAYGPWDNPTIEDGPAVTVKTFGGRTGDHLVTFNRAAAASQAFSRRFPTLQADIERDRAAGRAVRLPDEALTWLSRGLLEQILAFIERAADDTWALDIAIYEYELPKIVAAVAAAQARGCRVRVVYHANKSDPDDEQTTVNRQNLAGLPDDAVRARLTRHIHHHKFIILSRLRGGGREPQAVLCGSTNFTENGVYRQANVVHVVQVSAIAQQYLDLFEVLFRGDDTRATKKFINQNNAFGTPRPVFAGFSPRSRGADLDAFIEIIDAARRDVFFCTAFNLSDRIEEALLGREHDPILRYGLQNSIGRIKGVHADRTDKFVAAALGSDGLEGWLRESAAGQRGSIYIHTKLVIVDFTSDAPTVISGSHNFSRNASADNDENYLILRGNTDVADSYACEFLRFFDHYRFRWFLAEQKRRQQRVRKPVLAEDDTWTNPYFGGDALRTADRLRFAGEPV
ncbi:MAG TPA: phospholipase D-like domain-containing protein [Dehalococcoidia bacterium]|nr:phospholipase D-like domain-containing protein [Dehalococcoidia bacterium]